MSEQNLALGFYGKLPSLGDFVSRRLPQNFISSWDNWLQSSLMVSKESLGEQWLESYLTSPIWRFALSPGLVNQDAWIGIVMPSVDRVGRYFPLTIACKVNSHIPLVKLFSEACQWFEGLETIALSALDNDLAVDEFDEMVKSIKAFEIDPKHQMKMDKGHNQGNQTAFYLEFESAEIKVEQLFVPLSSLLLNTYIPSHSLWCSVGSEVIKPGFLMVDGMPPFAAYTGMITGKFKQTGWELQQQKIFQTDKQCHKEENKKDGVSIRDVSRLSKEKSDDINSNTIISTEEQRALTNRWKSYARTDTGMVRKYNEDAILERPDIGLWVVADGMGGHKAGDIASKKIIHTLNKLEITASLDISIPQVKAALQLVNNELKSLAANTYGQQIIGSTVVALIAGENHFAYLWAGDSRLYRLRDNKLIQLTIDHCSEYEDITDILSLGTGTGLKQNNVITRAVGAHEELELDYQLIEIQKGDVFLLSSDGLDKELSFNEIEQVLITNKYKESVDILMEQVLTKGSRDNISVIVININE